MRIHLIWAQDRDGGIGKNNAIPWHISEDLKNFKRLTLNHPIIMGRKTWESLPLRPLPKRRNVVLSSQILEGVECYSSPVECLAAMAQDKYEDIFVIGGARVYNAFFPTATDLHVTFVSEIVSGVDTYFPVSLEEIRKIFSPGEEKILSGNTKYIHWVRMMNK